MAAQAALQATWFRTAAKFKTSSNASIFPHLPSVFLSWSASKASKSWRLTSSPSTTSGTKPACVVLAKSSDQMERSLRIRFESEASIASEPFGEQQLKVNVNLTPNGTRKAFDIVLENMRKSSPPVQGFRRGKGGKSVIAKDVLYRMLGPSTVDSFVVEVIVSSSVLEYVEEKGFKVKKDFKTIQSSKELAAQFKAGKEFVFDAILSLEDAGMEATTSVEN